MDLWNESHGIAAFLKQVLYLINAVHKLYNYTSICHCQIYTLLHTVRLRWFHFIALQMDFWKRISLKFLCSTDRQSTWKTWGSLCKCSTYNTPWNKKCGTNKHWIFALFQYSDLFKCRLQPSVPFPHQEAPFWNQFHWIMLSCTAMSLDLTHFFKSDGVLFILEDIWSKAAGGL